MKKLIILLINILILTTLSACSSSSITENGTIDATTNITWNSKTEEINVSTVTIKCNDNYYGVVVNDSINFNNDNNYFTTGDGLLIQITDNEDTLVSNDSIYSYKATIEDNVSLYVSGDDENNVKEVFNNVFKTNKESYQMFSHDINQDWISNVVITSDVVSFSNGNDTTYIYQNEGSLSEGCLDGKIEPTVFKKQLRGIDIPITYPEEIEGVSNYIPYGTETYKHWSNEGYTPYSAYSILEYDDIDVGNLSTSKVKEIVDERATHSSNFIILANNDNNVLNLFNEKNTHVQNLLSLTFKPLKLKDTLTINSYEYLSSAKNIALSVINSDNRYHFGVLETYGYLNQWTETNKNGYYVDGNSYLDIKIAGQMSGKLVMPTIKYSMPTYNGNIVNSLTDFGNIGNLHNTNVNGNLTTYDYSYATEVFESTSIISNNTNDYQFSNHGAAGNAESLVILDIDMDSDFILQYFVLEGDYIYYFYDDKLLIFENTATKVTLDKILPDSYEVGFNEDNQFSMNLTKYEIYGDFNKDPSISSSAITFSCFTSGSNNLTQYYNLSSMIIY